MDTKKSHNKVRWGIEKVDESNLGLDNKVRRVVLNVYYKKGPPNKGEYFDVLSALKALVAFSEV